MERNRKMEKYRVELLPDVFLTVLDTDKFRTNYLSLNILRPLRREEAALNALLPDVLLRGCRICPDMQEIAAWLDQRYGAGVQSVVRKKGEIQAIGFFFDYVNERFAEPKEDLTGDICNLLGSFLLEPVLDDGVFRQDYVDGEKVNLCNAIMAQINDKRIYAAMRLRQEMFAGEAYGVSKNGEKEDVETITARSLYEHYRHILGHSRIELMFAGRTDRDHLIGCLRRSLSALPREHVDAVGTEPGPMPEQVREFQETMDVKQGNLVMGFRTGITSADAAYPALLMFNGIYGGGITSKLFRNVREKLSLCYYASSGLDRIKGVMVVSSGIDPENYGATKDEILRQLEACRAGDITEEEITSVRNALCTSLRSSEDSLGRMEDFYLTQETGGFSYTPEELMEALMHVTTEQIRQAACSIHLDTVFFLKGEN